MTLIIEKLMIEIIKKYKSDYRKIIKTDKTNLGVNYNYYQYLYVINKYNGINQIELAKKMNVLKSSSSKAVKNLTASKLIIIIKDEEDLRIKKLYITENGRKLLDDFILIIKKTNKKLLKGFSNDEVEEVKDFLLRIYKNINNDLESNFLNSILEMDNDEKN
jgi:DNA-binding MarR family transcriptional regulator